MATKLFLEDIKKKAEELGWDDVGVTYPTISQEDIDAYTAWIKKGKHADLKYMEKEIRCRPQELLPGAKTAIIFISYYKQSSQTYKPNEGLIASYARGKDYHNVHRRRLKKFCKWLEEIANEDLEDFLVYPFSDASPIMEKALAVQAGLGWIGKNTLLIHRKYGTFTLLSGILTNLECAEISPPPLRLPRCGSCTKCLDACPTQALSPYELDAAKCLSYQLIESKKEVPLEISSKNPGYIFGCDICQDVCPHNVRKNEAKHSELSESEGIGAYLDKNTLDKIQKNPELLYGTPLKRAGPKKLRQVFEDLQNNT
ncbi:MAG: tRNA epoxyqueuosine(34) reductase QueG [Chlamydiales bacterium]